jgi:hypothetical protein
LHPCGSASSDSASSLRPTSPYSLIGYLSASIEWAQFAGDSKAWQRWWLEPDSRHAYFMGKDNIVFHSFLWPATLAGYDGPLCELPDGTRVPLHRPDDIVASEFLTMEGRKFSSSRRVVIYVRDVLERYGPDPLRFSLAAGGPETADADFTWAEFVRRNNDELVATWGNLVQRVCAMLRRTGGVVPERTAHLPDGRELLSRVEAGFDTVGSAIAWHRFKQALSEALRLAHDVNAFVSLNEPWKVAKTDPELALGILSAAYDAVCDLNVMLTPFLPPRRPRVWNNLGADVTVPMPVVSEVGADDDKHLVLRTRPETQRWQPHRTAPEPLSDHRRPSSSRSTRMSSRTSSLVSPTQPPRDQPATTPLAGRGHQNGRNQVSRPNEAPDDSSGQVAVGPPLARAGHRAQGASGRQEPPEHAVERVRLLPGGGCHDQAPPGVVLHHPPPVREGYSPLGQEGDGARALAVLDADVRRLAAVCRRPGGQRHGRPPPRQQ